MDRAKACELSPRAMKWRREVGGVGWGDRAREGGSWWWETFSETLLGHESSWFFTMDSGATEATGLGKSKRHRTFRLPLKACSSGRRCLRHARAPRPAGARCGANYGLWIYSCCISASVSCLFAFKDEQCFRWISLVHRCDTFPSRIHSWIANKPASTTKLNFASVSVV